MYCVGGQCKQNNNIALIYDLFVPCIPQKTRFQETNAVELNIFKLKCLRTVDVPWELHRPLWLPPPSRSPRSRPASWTEESSQIFQYNNLKYIKNFDTTLAQLTRKFVKIKHFSSFIFKMKKNDINLKFLGKLLKIVFNLIFHILNESQKSVF